MELTDTADQRKQVQEMCVSNFSFLCVVDSVLFYSRLKSTDKAFSQPILIIGNQEKLKTM